MKFFRFAVRPSISLNPGPFYVVEGSNVTLPVCHVTGYPTPLITWSKSFGRLPKGRVHSNNSAIQLLGVRKDDSDNYLCTATNLLGTVVKRTVLVLISLPQFTVKPPAKVTVSIGETLTLNCSATGDPEPVMNWKKQKLNSQLVVASRLMVGYLSETLKRKMQGITFVLQQVQGCLTWKLSPLSMFCLPKVNEDTLDYQNHFEIHSFFSRNYYVSCSLYTS